MIKKHNERGKKKFSGTLNSKTESCKNVQERKKEYIIHKYKAKHGSLLLITAH
jgi:hypothetical protein